MPSPSGEKFWEVTFSYSLKKKKVNDLSGCSCMDSPIVLYVYIAGDHSLGLPVILMWMRYFVNFDNLYSLLPYIAPSHWLPTLEAQMLQTQVHPFPRHQSCREVICQSSWNRTPETVLPRRLLCNGSHRNQAGNATRLEGPLYVHTRQGTRLDKRMDPRLREVSSCWSLIALPSNVWFLSKNFCTYTGLG